MFPNSPARGEEFSLTKPRNPDNTSKRIKKTFRRLGFPELRLHDLRGSHETALLDAGVPLHVVAARGGHDPAVLMRSYAKRTKKADQSAARSGCIVEESARKIALGPSWVQNDQGCQIVLYRVMAKALIRKAWSRSSAG